MGPPGPWRIPKEVKAFHQPLGLHRHISSKLSKLLHGDRSFAVAALRRRLQQSSSETWLARKQSKGAIPQDSGTMGF